MEKKNPYKFTLGFDKTKLTHVRAAEILNSVRDKADLIASAVVAHIDGGSTEKGAVLNQSSIYGIYWRRCKAIEPFPGTIRPSGEIYFY